MGLNIEFYSADAKALATLFADYDEDGFDAYSEQLDSYPMADFSLHLEIPSDMDSLCQALHQQNPQIPTIFRDILVEQIWDDGIVSESLTVLSGQFVEQLALLSENAVETAARTWTSTFPPSPSQQAPQETATYQAVWQLQAVAQDAVHHKRSLLLHLCG